MPYLLCTGLGNQYLAGNRNMNHCLHFKDLGVVGGGLGTNCNCKIVSVCVCVRAVPIFKINCMKFYLYICMRFQCRINSEKWCDNLLLSFYKTCSCCWKVVFIYIYISEWLFVCVFLYFGVCTVWMCVLCASKYEIRVLTDLY